MVPLRIAKGFDGNPAQKLRKTAVWGVGCGVWGVGCGV